MPANVSPEVDASLAQMWRQVWQKTRAICQEEIRKVLAANYVGGKLDGGAIGGTVPTTALPMATTAAAGIAKVDNNMAGAPVAITTASLGATNGVAELDNTGNVPFAELGNIPVGSASAFGLVKADGSTITASGGVLSAVGGGTLSVTTKGDLQGYSTVPDRVPVGANGTVLTADSTQGLGVKWVPGGYGALTLIQAQVVSGSPAASLTFSAIPGAYTHLRLIYQVRASAGGNNFQVLELQCNGDTAGNYDDVIWDMTGSATHTGQAYINAAYISGSGAAASYAAGGEILIPNYAGTAFFKNTLSDFGMQSGLNRRGVYSGTWKSTAAITSLLLKLDANSFAVGSTVSLYGVS